MKKRLRKLLSVLLASAMVFTMNTTAFAEEIGEVDEAVEAAAEVQAETDGVDDGAEVDDVYDGSVDNEVLDDLNTIIQKMRGYSGIFVDSKGNIITKVSYEKDGTDKKAAEATIATIRNTDDPVSWNNYYGRELITTVLFGSDVNDQYLNGKTVTTVSRDNANPGLEKIHSMPIGYSNVECIPVKKGESYIFLAYGLEKSNIVYVNGYDEMEEVIPYAFPRHVPITYWDGRTVEYNKNGKYKKTKSKREILNVKMAFVTYKDGTVTEIPGVDIGKVKVDKKNQKGASVYAESLSVNKKITDREEQAFPEFQKITDLPYFTVKAKISGKEAKEYKKDIDKALGDDSSKYYFGITQSVIGIDESIFDDMIMDKSAYNVVSENGKEVYTVSDGNAEIIEEKIAGLLSDGVYHKEDYDGFYINYCQYSESIGYYELLVKNFNGEKANIDVFGVVGDSEKGYVPKKLNSLKYKKDFYFKDGKMANTDVKVLEFPDKGNYAYAGLCYTIDDEGNPFYYLYNPAQLGYRYAFRRSPDPKSKTFRVGIYNRDNVGFVFSEDGQ